MQQKTADSSVTKDPLYSFLEDRFFHIFVSCKMPMSRRNKP